ncbi:MAG: hypothetical protein COA36_06995 [Desulfotalea sp.]|nr:MAG: hypothetical protein COA36_06995 [Desulfotalea sp.]
MKTRILLLLTITLFFLTSCSSKIQVSQDYDSTYNFAQAQAYNWKQKDIDSTAGILKDNGLMAGRFFSAIEACLKSQGFSLANNPDFLVSFTYEITSHLQTGTIQPTVGLGYGRHGRYGGFGVQSGTSVRQYQRGQLTIDIFASNNGALIWKGLGTREVFVHNNPEQLTKDIFELVRSTLTQFPPANH